MSKIGAPTAFQIILILSQKMLVDSAAMRWRMFLGIALELAGVALGILGPYFLKSLVDAFAADATTGAILTLVGLFVLSWSGASILSTIRSAYSTRVIDQITEDLATSSLRSELPESARTKTSDTGAMLGLLERLPYSLSVIIDGLIWRTMPVALQLVGSLWLVCALIPIQYAAILTLVLVGYVLTTWLTAKTYKRRSSDANLAIGTLSRETGDILRNARRVVFNGALDLEIGNLRSCFRKKTNANTKLMWSLVSMVAWQYGVVGLGLIALLSLGTIDVLAHRMTLGDFVLLQAYALRLAAPLSGIGFILSQSALAIANVCDVLAVTKQQQEDPDTSPGAQGPAHIVLSEVCFGYSPDKFVLRNINLEIQPGSFVAIVGSNGSGKSTLAQVMAGILKPERGQVLIGGHPLNLVPFNQRYRHILYIPQFIGAFNRSLKANGLYPPTELTEEKLIERLTRWGFYEGPRQIDMEAFLGEQGERLSGGQLQKLELARIAGVPVSGMVLDESTSALDPAIEATIIAELRASLSKRTTIVLITHRETIARQADSVLYLREGTVAGFGTHEQLLIQLKDYAELWVTKDDVLSQ